MRYVVGIDIGGTNIVVGTVAEDGSEMLGLVSEPTISEQGANAVVGRITKLARASMAAARGHDVAGVGIGSPGPLNTTTGVVLLTPNLGWTNFPLRDRITEALGLPATLDNDANCAIFGEWWRGAARGSQHVVGLTIGTGIGGGIVLDGEVYRGASDIAGEIGHMTIDLNGRRCKCGNYGCLEAYASGPAIAARAVEGIADGTDTSLPKYVNGDLSKITAQLVYEAAHDGDDYALEVVKDTAKFLGVGVANIINIFNPQVVVICGGVTLAGERLFGPLRSEAKRRAFKPAVDVCRIVPGELTGTAGVYGAAAVFMRRTWGRV
ncbi:MAG: transcriptional regulator [Gemmatimonadetes bacterium]|nr:MAG: transcriptional regulator [Gemmatimonadota bacterium]